MTNDSITDIAHKLAFVFKDNPYKITVWWLTPNPHFGEIAPFELFIINPKKVVGFINSAIEGEGA